MSEERHRRQDMTRGLEGIDHADTFPEQSMSSTGNYPLQQLQRPGTALTAESSGVGMSMDKNEQEHEPPEPSTRSHDPINVSFKDDGKGVVQGEQGKPRKRRTLLGKFGDRPDDYDEEAASISTDPADMLDKQQFTAAGQLKATIFNSWMNIFILAAPVGSEYCDPSFYGMGRS